MQRVNTQASSHTTSSGIQIEHGNDGKTYITPPYGMFEQVSLSDTEFRELVMYGMAYFETKSKDGR